MPSFFFHFLVILGCDQRTVVNDIAALSNDIVMIKNDIAAMKHNIVVPSGDKLKKENNNTAIHNLTSMITQNTTLENILTHLWGRLQRGAADGKHAYHFPVLATLGGGKVQQRTVVLRKVDTDRHLLFCFTDVRSPKVQSIRENAQAHWLFYDPETKEQIRAESQAVLHHQDVVSRQLWDTIPPAAKGDYLGPVAPGTVSATYTDNLPQAFKAEPSEASTEKGFQYFCVLTGEITTLDFLALRKEGHIRAKFTRKGHQWQSAWLAP